MPPAWHMGGRTAEAAALWRSLLSAVLRAYPEPAAAASQLEAKAAAGGGGGCARLGLGGEPGCTAAQV